MVAALKDRLCFCSSSCLWMLIIWWNTLLISIYATWFADDNKLGGAVEFVESREALTEGSRQIRELGNQQPQKV